MAKNFYEFIEHTADIGIRVKAGDLKELFKNAASAMFDIIAEQKIEIRKQKSEKIIIKQKAENLEELFVNWLNELLSLSAVKYLIFDNFQINKINKNSLQAVAFGRSVKDYRMNVEIKAATYHELKVQRIESGWQAQIIFDV